MANAVDNLDLDNAIDRKYWLAYQKEAITEEARLEVWEKSIRIGATFCKAFRAVRRRMQGKGNYLHTSVNERIAKAFAVDCKKFCKIFDVVGASDVREFETWNAQENRRETAFEIEFKKQECSIEVFSSNPDSLRGKGGDVGIDEICSHKQPDAMLQAAGGRAMWGHSVEIWSSHKGMNSALNRLIKQERALGDKSRWKIRSTNLIQAIDQGLLDKINQITGKTISREDFLADTKAMVGGEDAFLEECMLQPKNAGSQAIKWGYLDAAKKNYPLYRKHIEGNESFDAEAWIAPLVEILRAAESVSIGYDVARTGHLSSIPIMAKFGGRWKHMALLTMHKRSFALQREAAIAFMRAVPSAVGAGDAGGLGMETCEILTDIFGEYRWASIMFGTHKAEMGTRMIRIFEDGDIDLSDGRDDEDVVFDIAAIQTAVLPSGRATFVETANPINKLSHCDIAWSIALALFVGEDSNQKQGIL